MKYVLLFLLSLPAVIYGQQKKDTRIVVTSTDTAQLFKRLTVALYKEGYSLEEKDEEAQFLATKGKSLSRWNAFYKIKVLVEGNTVTLSGQYRIPAAEDSSGEYWVPIQYTTRKGSIPSDCWMEVLKIAQGIGGHISYSK